MHCSGTVKELREALKASLAKSKQRPAPKYWSWDAYPAGWMAYRSWQRFDSERRAERRAIRRQIAKLEGK
jgi:hypothetical protein